MSDKKYDVAQHLLYELLKEKEQMYGKTKVVQVCRDFIRDSRQPKMPKIEKEDMGALEKKADRVFAKHIVRRDRKCITCGTTKKLTCSHYYKRGRQAIRFSEINCHAQCEECNNKHNTDTRPFRSFMETKFTTAELSELEMKSRQLKQWTAEEYKAIIEQYSKQL